MVLVDGDTDAGPKPDRCAILDDQRRENHTHRSLRGAAVAVVVDDAAAADTKHRHIGFGIHPLPGGFVRQVGLVEDQDDSCPLAVLLVVARPGADVRPPEADLVRSGRDRLLQLLVVEELAPLADIAGGRTFLVVGVFGLLGVG